MNKIFPCKNCIVFMSCKSNKCKRLLTDLNELKSSIINNSTCPDCGSRIENYKNERYLCTNKVCTVLYDFWENNPYCTYNRMPKFHVFRSINQMSKLQNWRK